MTQNETERQAIEARYEAVQDAIDDLYYAELDTILAPIRARYWAERKPIDDRYLAELKALKGKP